MRSSPADTKVTAEGCGTPEDPAKTRNPQQTKEKTTHPVHLPHLSKNPPNLKQLKTVWLMMTVAHRSSHNPATKRCVRSEKASLCSWALLLFPVDGRLQKRKSLVCPSLHLHTRCYCTCNFPLENWSCAMQSWSAGFLCHLVVYSHSFSFQIFCHICLLPGKAVVYFVCSLSVVFGAVIPSEI